MNGPPARPDLPPVVWFALAMAAGCVIGEAVSWRIAEGFGVAIALRALLPAGSGTAIAAAVGWRRAALRPVAALLCGGLIAGVLLSGLQGAAWQRQVRTAGACGAREWAGTVEADPLPGAFGVVVRVRIEGGPLDGARVRVGWPAETLAPEVGRTVRFAAILKPLPCSEPWARRTARSGVCATGNAWRAEVGGWRPGPTGPLFAWRQDALARMHSVEGPGGDLAEGIVLGDRRRLTGTDADEDFKVLGLTHLVAVSGSHLALACAAVAFLCRLLRVPKRPLVVATVAAGAAYAVVTGMPYSALRSLLMLAVGGGAELIGRRSSGLASLATALIGVLLLEPWSVFDTGLQLSAFAVCGLLLFGSLATEWLTRGLAGPARLAAGTLALTLVAQFMTAPVVAGSFGMLSLLAPLANAYAGPMVSLALLLGLGAAVTGGVLPDVAELGSRACAGVLAAAAWIASWMARLPGAAIALGAGPALVLGTVVAAAALWVWWPLPRAPRAGLRALSAATCVTLLLALGPAPMRRATITVLDVGQGDAILVRDSGRAMLVDVGSDPTVLRRALARTGVRVIDVLVLTHAHGDHTGGAGGLSGVVQVGWIAVPDVGEDEAGWSASARDPMPGNAAWDGPDAPVRAVSAGDSWRIGGTRVRVIWPAGDSPGDLKTNDTSVVLQISRGAFDMALTGDAEGVAQSGMIAQGELHQVEVLKVPHHGSTNGLTAEGLAGWLPQDAIISVGAGNDFGHPCPETLELLGTSGIRVYRTDECGDIEVAVRSSGYSIRTARRGSPSAVRARMQPGGRLVLAAHRRDSGTAEEEGLSGSQDDRRAEARLPHLRGRGPAPGARAPPPSGSRREVRRPRLQLRGVRRRDRRRYRGGRGREHAAVRIGEAPGHRPGGRSDARNRPGRARRIRAGPCSDGVSRPGRAQDAEGLETAQGGGGTRRGRRVPGAEAQRVSRMGHRAVRIEGSQAVA
ncbi:MAG: DNA internalization-related competence protein ComEC/Rec2 [Actinobacteria bacterium]|nr:DNA internalization-related competence protein ComEC/Rec2 [Actinomycetota bacterium]